MNSIKIIHKLSELGSLVERYSTDIYIAKGDKPSESFKAEVRKVAKELIEMASFSLSPHVIKGGPIESSFGRLISEMINYFPNDRPQKEYLRGDLGALLVFSICHKMGVELEGSDE